MHKIEKRIIKLILIEVSIILNVMLTGAVLNLEAVSENGGRMPVYGAIGESNTHFAYTNPSEVKFHSLADIYTLPGIYFSIGDVIMVLGFLVLCGLMLANIIKIIKSYPTIKNERQRTH